MVIQSSFIRDPMTKGSPAENQVKFPVFVWFGSGVRVQNQSSPCGGAPLRTLDSAWGIWYLPPPPHISNNGSGSNWHLQIASPRFVFQPSSIHGIGFFWVSFRGPRTYIYVYMYVCIFESFSTTRPPGAGLRSLKVNPGFMFFGLEPWMNWAEQGV